MDSKKKKWQPYITVIIFCLLIFGFTAATIMKPAAEFSETENRVLAQAPEVKAETILDGGFEEAYEEYLTDQFIGRDRWILLKTSVERLLFKRESKDIYFAKDNYLIEKHTGVFAAQTAQRNIGTLAAFAKRYEEQFEPGHLSVLIVPNAVDILENKLPPFAESGEGRAYLEQLSDILPQDVWIDADSVLRGHRKEEIYYRTDHHWKTLAAFYVYQEWAKERGFFVPELDDYEIDTVTDCFEGTVQSKLGIHTSKDAIELFFPKEETRYIVGKNNSEETADSLYDFSALDTKDKYAVYFGGNEPFLKIRTEADNGRKILVIKDSYANCFIPFMLGEFREIDVIDLRYTNQKLSELIAEGGYTDLLILYNASGFAEDRNITKLTN